MKPLVSRLRFFHRGIIAAQDPRTEEESKLKVRRSNQLLRAAKLTESPAFDRIPKRLCRLAATDKGS